MIDKGNSCRAAKLLLLAVPTLAAYAQQTGGRGVPGANSGSVTAAAIQSALAGQTGCSSIGYTYSPQSGSCVSSSGVTSFSSGALSPLFTTSVASSTTTPALSFTLTNAAANTAFGNFTASSGAPSYTATTGTGAPVAANSPALTGTPTAPTQAISTNNTYIATTAAVNAALSAYAPTASLGTAATQNTGTSGATIPLNNGANTESGATTFSAAGAASTPTVNISGAPYAGTGSTSLGALHVGWNTGTLPSTLNTAGTGFTMFAPSGFGGNLVDMYTGTVDEFFVTAGGVATANVGGFSTSATLTAASGVYGRGSSPINLQTTTAATSSTSQAPGALKFLGTYWNGSASATNTTTETMTAGGGTNGTETLTFANSGSTGQFTVSVAGSLNQTTAGAASTPGLWTTGAPYTGGSASTNYPQNYFDCSGATEPTTFSTAGTEVGVNACNGFTGHLINLFVNGGSTRFRVDYQGNTFVAGTETVASNLGLSSTAAPTIANGAGAGTSPGTPTVTGNNNSGVITVITGTSPTASATLATVTFNGTLGTVPNGCGLTPRNAATTGATLFYTTAPTSTAFTIGVGSTAAAASTTYSWSYLCL